MSHHFDKSRRLLTKRDYAYVFQDAHKLVIHGFMILYRNNNKGYARLGLALSKRAVPKAHDRNRLKRLVRETFRTAAHLPAIDMVVLAKPDVLKAEQTVLTYKLEQAWSKLWQKHGMQTV